MSSILSILALVVLIVVFIMAVYLFISGLEYGDWPIFSGIIITVYVIFALIWLFK